MIKQLVHNDRAVSIEMQTVFQASYAIEAQLLNAIDFPPLKRKLETYINSENVFFGYLVGQKIAGIIEIDQSLDAIHIQSLVVHPTFFRQGVARHLLESLFNTHKPPFFTVETGLENGPAIALYKKFGFREVKQFDTDHGIRKICFKRKID
jgi:ribosomal protein S18 acetylase RimI-like enzyme